MHTIQKSKNMIRAKYVVIFLIYSPFGMCHSGRIIERFLFCLIGFGRWNDNWFLSFIEDNFFPIPACCGQKLFKKKPHLANSIIQKSWKRRVDVNVFWYFGLILCLAILNILVTPCVGILDPDFDKLPKPFDSFSMLVGLRGGLQFLMVHNQLMIVVGKKKYNCRDSLITRLNVLIHSP